jgi:hypothetical protein
LVIVNVADQAAASTETPSGTQLTILQNTVHPNKQTLLNASEQSTHQEAGEEEEQGSREQHELGFAPFRHTL